MELDQRLGLYQVFLKVYQHNSSLLEEILQLENSSNSLSGLKPRYVQGVIQDREIYLVTNLVTGQTQKLRQKQQIWTIGRDRQLAIPLADNRLSRYHAVIQYIKNQGFYLIDLNSTNGSYVNGEAIYTPHLLQDADRIRLGSLSFSFFISEGSQIVEDVPPHILTQLGISPTPSVTSNIEQIPRVLEPQIYNDEVNEDTALFLSQLSSEPNSAKINSSTQLNSTEKSEILDRFLNRKSDNNGYSQ